MSTPAPLLDRVPLRGALADPVPSINTWRQRFLAPINHEGHDVPDVNELFHEHMTFGQRAADAVAHQLGSWRFLTVFDP
jgi:uncharacterized membrane protein